MRQGSQSGSHHYKCITRRLPLQCRLGSGRKVCRDKSTCVCTIDSRCRCSGCGLIAGPTIHRLAVLDLWFMIPFQQFRPCGTIYSLG